MLNYTKISIAYSAQVRYCTAFHCLSIRPSVHPSVYRCDIHISPMYIGIYAICIISMHCIYLQDNPFGQWSEWTGWSVLLGCLRCQDGQGVQGRLVMEINCAIVYTKKWYLSITKLYSLVWCDVVWSSLVCKGSQDELVFCMQNPPCTTLSFFLHQFLKIQWHC